MSYDCGLGLGHNVRMVQSETEAQFKQRFTKRIKEARIALGWKQWQMADALGITQDKYKHYESRSLLPHHQMGRFCLITRTDPEWLLTGQGQKPLKPIHPVESTEPVQRKAPRKAKAKRAA